jgi:hypothetical protein
VGPARNRSGRGGEDKKFLAPVGTRTPDHPTVNKTEQYKYSGTFILLNNPLTQHSRHDVTLDFAASSSKQYFPINFS